MTCENDDEIAIVIDVTKKVFLFSTFSLLYQVVTWSSASINMLRNAEKRILSFLKTPYKGFYIDIGRCVSESDKIWTIALNTQSQRTPLVLLHGLGAGSALWVMNYDAFARHRPVYSIDILGET